jgi:hypothetical protein
MIEMPEVMLNTVHYVVTNTAKKIYRNGVEMEKGAVMTSRRIEKNRKLYETYFNFWIQYPDLFLDFIKPLNSHFQLFFYQRLFIRLALRYPRLFVIAPRAFSKSFISILALYLICMFKPNGKYFIVAPGKARKIAPCRRETA